MEEIKLVSEAQYGNIMVQVVSWNGFTIDMLKSLKAPSGANFLPSKVTDASGAVQWSFKRDHPNYRGLATLVAMDDEYVVVLATKKELHWVLPIIDLPHMQVVNGELIGGRKLREIIDLKQLIAWEFGLEPVWTNRERKMIDVLQAVEEVERKAREKERIEALVTKQKAEEERKEARRLVREAKRAEIVSRGRIVGYTVDGRRRFGYPVVGDEWQTLVNGTFCISVCSFDKELGSVGELIEAFVIKKGSARPIREQVVSVAEQDTISRGKSKFESLEMMTSVIIPIGGEMEEVFQVGSMDRVHELNRRGLNSGTLVMVPKVDDDTRHTVFRLIEGRIETVTELVRK